MTWRCARGCGAGGAKRYASAEEAERYARAFDREDREDLGRSTPCWPAAAAPVTRAQAEAP
jgi:hypothetical protein